MRAINGQQLTLSTLTLGRDEASGVPHAVCASVQFKFLNCRGQARKGGCRLWVVGCGEGRGISVNQSSGPKSPLWGCPNTYRTVDPVIDVERRYFVCFGGYGA